MFGRWLILGLCLSVSTAFAQQNNRVKLGRMQTGAIVTFIRSSGGEWGIEITGGEAPRIMQPKPCILQVFQAEDDIRELASGYNIVKQTTSGVDARTEIAYGENVVFQYT